ncbi:hypothetical protein Angca_001906, partial [Angiostrongylus cantonensis]
LLFVEHRCDETSSTTHSDSRTVEIVHLFCGFQCFDLFDDEYGLPWKRCDREEILGKKEKFFKLELSECYNIVPEDFKRLVEYINGLKYADEPDYVYLRNSLAAISKEARVDFSKPLDWAGITKRRAEKADKEV